MNHITYFESDLERNDKVTRYKLIPFHHMGLNKEEFLSSPFSVVSFWYSRRRSFPQLYKIAMRIYATPSSSSTKERVFSAVKKVITPERSCLTPEVLSQIIVARSLLAYIDN